MDRLKENYFDGSYFKVIDDNNKLCYAVIFGISTNVEDIHSFIQILDGNFNTYKYYRFDVEEYSKIGNTIRIRDNLFSKKKIKLNLDYYEADLNIVKSDKFKDTNFMGIFKNIKLPCKHEIIMKKCEVNGIINDIIINGTGYMEKDYGYMFPDNWIWICSNHFNNKDTFLMGVVTKIYKCKFRITLFKFILNIDNKEYIFSTQGLDEIKVNKIDNNTIIELKTINTKLKIRFNKIEGISLKAPSKEARMNRNITESINSKINLYLYKNNKLIYEDTSNYCAIEDEY